MAIDALPPLREVIEAHAIRAQKSLGQNFLCDLNLTARIARVAGDLENYEVLEIGPGPGGLTRALMAQGARRVVVIERDVRCLPALQDIARAYPGRLEVIHGDALKIDAVSLFKNKDRKIKIVANLPYNIGTQLLLNWLLSEPWPPFYHSMSLMFQREVAMRIVAEPAHNAYGRLAVLAGWRTDAHIAFDVPARAFTPPPKVVSSLVHFLPKEAPIPASSDKLECITKAAFGQRRKMLRQSLKMLGGLDLLARADIEPTRRAETLTVAEFVALANML